MTRSPESFDALSEIVSRGGEEPRADSRFEVDERLRLNEAKVGHEEAARTRYERDIRDAFSLDARSAGFFVSLVIYRKYLEGNPRQLPLY